MKNVSIDYVFNGYDDTVAFKITYMNNNGVIDGVYTSPFIFSNVSDAYHAAVIELSGK